MNYKSSNYKDN